MEQSGASQHWKWFLRCLCVWFNAEERLNQTAVNQNTTGTTNPWLRLNKFHILEDLNQISDLNQDKYTRPLLLLHFVEVFTSLTLILILYDPVFLTISVSQSFFKGLNVLFTNEGAESLKFIHVMALNVACINIEMSLNQDIFTFYVALTIFTLSN